MSNIKELFAQLVKSPDSPVKYKAVKDNLTEASGELLETIKSFNKLYADMLEARANLKRFKVQMGHYKTNVTRSNRIFRTHGVYTNLFSQKEQAEIDFFNIRKELLEKIGE
jgi:hypothetical protein